MIPNPITVPMQVSVDPTVPLGVSTVNVPLAIGTATAIQIIGGEHYDGVYEVTPLADFEIILPTQGKILDEDVVVNKIPYYETSNESGITVYIGE